MAVYNGAGRYAVYGVGGDAPLVGWLENGHITSLNGTWLFRVSGDVVYDVPENGAGVFGYVDEQGEIRSKGGQLKFRLDKA